MKLSDYKNEEAMLKLADLLDPISKIATGDAVKRLRESGEKNKIKIAQELLRSNPREIVDILAIIDDIPVEKYEVNIFALPMKIVELLNDPDIGNLFLSQGQSTEKTSSGSAMENTEA